MRVKPTAFGRRARSVCIVSQLSVTVQPKSKRLKLGTRIAVLYAGSATISVRRLESGEEVIVIEPP